MNKKLAKIAKAFNLEKLKNDKRIIVFAVCLLIAIALWFLNALGKNYSTTLSYSVRYVNPPENLFLASSPPTKLELNVEAHGFTLLRHKLALSFSPIVLDLTAINQSLESNGKTISVPSETLIRRIENQISKEISITEISPRTISITFDSLATKMVPVNPQVTLEFKSQFNLKGSVLTIPDSIKVSGPANIIDTIKSLQTEPKTFHDLEANTERIVNIKQLENVKLSTEKVMLFIPVEKFTEKELILPIEVLNKPEEVQIKLFPSQVSVSVMVGLSEYENITTGNFTASVDFTQATAGNSVLDVQVEAEPSFLKLLKVSPTSVEFLVETE